MTRCLYPDSMTEDEKYLEISRILLKIVEMSDRLKDLNYSMVDPIMTEGY